MSHRRESLILALLQSVSLKDAARKAGLSYRTAKRWHAEESFRSELDSARKEAFTHSLRMVQGISAKAVAALLRNLKVDKAGDRTTAARAILEFAFRGWEDGELGEKVRELEALVKELKLRKP
jgi:hypothetical protein